MHKHTLLQSKAPLSQREQEALEAERLARQQAEHIANRLERIQAVTAALSAALTMQEVAQVMVVQGLEPLAADSGGISLLNVEGTELKMAAVAGYRREDIPEWERISTNLPLPTNEVVETGKAIWMWNRDDWERSSYMLPKDHFLDSIWGVLPLQVDGRMLGVWALSFGRDHIVTDADQAFALTLADLCAQALERARLFEAEQQARTRAELAARRLGRIQAVTAALSVAITQREVAKVMVEQGLAALAAAGGSISLLNEDGTLLELAAVAGYSKTDAERWERFSTDLPLPSNHVLKTGQPLWLWNQNDWEQGQYIIPTDSLLSQSCGVLPLQIDGRVVGVWGFAFDSTHVVTDDDQAFATTLAGLCAQALERARLYEAEHQARDKAEQARHTAEVLQEASTLLVRSLDLTQVLNALLDCLGQLVPYISAGVMLRTGNCFQTAAFHSNLYPKRPRDLTWYSLEHADSGMLAHIVETRQSVLIEDTHKDTRWHVWDGYEYIHSWMGVPLLVDNELVGIFSVDHQEAGFFDHEHLQRAELLAMQSAVAIRNARLFQAMDIAQREQQALSRRLVEVQEDERRTLARELHDELGQTLTGLAMALDLQVRRSGNAALIESRDAVRELIGKVRDLSLDLRPSMLDDLGLLPALLWQIRRFTKNTAIEVTFSHNGLECTLSPDINTAIYRIVQEALTNIARHAKINRAHISMRVQAHHLHVRIADEGQGFDLAQLKTGRPSNGLSSMRERVVLHGGSLQINSAPGHGTVIMAQIPLPAEEQAS
ncbi:MAG: GAF domain-containing sensor histidine kinase [Chloroflexaceae bacterium]|jgi:signal transduction histidine kinase|nr:GAF domain-containing sensor histidine kinase [Chloroflexaceae bacterium]